MDFVWFYRMEVSRWLENKLESDFLYEAVTVLKLCHKYVDSLADINFKNPKKMLWSNGQNNKQSYKHHQTCYR